MTKVIAVAALSVLGWTGSAASQEILKREPPRGTLRTGTFVYVDNGRCPKGQVMKVSGGSFSGRNTTAGIERERVCVPRP